VPERNEGDAAEIPDKELGNLEFVFVDEVSKALDVALS
jgi:ATP-dependent Lon protease